MTQRSVTVSVLGAEYSIRSSEDPAYVKRLAYYVDEKMREAQRDTQLVSTMKIAVLAALGIADDFHKAAGRTGQQEDEERRRLESLEAILDAVLESTGAEKP